MAQLILPQLYDEQPQESAVPVDWSNPLAAGIVSLATPTVGDAARGKVASLSGNATLAVSTQGRVWQGASANCPVDIGASGGLTSLVASGTSWTWYGRIFVSVLGVRQIFIGDYDTGGSNETFGFEIQASNVWRFQTANTTPEIIGVAGGAATLGWHDLIVTLATSGSGYDLSAYVDEVLVGTVNSPLPIRSLGSAFRLMNAGAYTGGVSFQGLMVVSALWNRALPPAERMAVPANPWQLFEAPPLILSVSAGAPATTPVSSDLAATYAVSGQVSSDRAAAYVISAQVGADLAAAYSVKSAVNADLAATYSLHQAVSSDLTAAYTLRQSVTADLAVTYNIASATMLVSADLAASYNIASSVATVSNDLAASYAVREFVNSSLAAAYALNAAVHADLAALYAVAMAVSADLAASYAIAQAANKDLACAYTINGVASASLSAVYAIESEAIIYARAPSGSGYRREFSNTSRPTQQNTTRNPR
jgi:hypothetical protein